MDELPRFAAMAPNSGTGENDRPRIRVRAATSGDVGACADLATSVSDIDHQTWTQILHRDLAGEDRLLAVATRGKHVVGYGRTLYFTPPADAPGNVAPAGYYLLGLVVDPTHRRMGAGAALTAYRLAWLADRTKQAWYFADIRNGASRALHANAGFTEVTSDFWFPGASESDDSHMLCRMELVNA